ncbi:TIGR02530 family flagellar biosynthesis protein [Thermohalobacter berrensis]|uniref:Flagellar protein n=1 Tax=Thermohalobacter berrensis TaxID=99594 RepID=A0A419TAD9_9FIRM|nr:TIGR02530 family flagellar biosynthesis protein [Thermohalobacter berrensis]RKD34440.1 flagellar protein [Thermohalobacter berrensis]
MDKLNLNKINNNIIKNRYSVANNNVKYKKSFEEVFNQIKNNNSVKFSKHAQERMKLRNINLNSEQIKSIEKAIDKAANKGVKEALILMNNTAFIASINNRTIITTATEDQLKENVFTNIDGAVII